jgi:hypothetical protein
MKPRPRPLRAALWLAPPVLVGALLRLWGLHRQLFLGDELHAVMSALTRPLPDILTTYRLADHSIPLAALYRLLTEWGVELSEEVLRAPSALAGLALLVLVPAALLRWPGGEGGLCRAPAAAWLLAISPTLVYFSRFARPYAMVALLATVAAVAFWRWWEAGPHGGHGWAVLYAASGAASGWFFLGALPFVAAPLAWAAGDLLAGRFRGGDGEGRRGPVALLAVAAGFAAGVAAFLLPALPSLLRLLEVKAARGSAGLDAVLGVLRIQAGTAAAVPAVAFWALAALGLGTLARRHPRLAGYGALLVAAQWIALSLVLRPSGIHAPHTLNRYLVATVPVVLLWAAEGLSWLAGEGRQRGRWGRRLGTAGAVAAVAAVGLAGPYVSDPGFRLGPFAGDWETLALERRPVAFPASLVPPAVLRLAAEPGDDPVAQVVGRFGPFSLWPVAAWARLHGRPVILAADAPWVADPRLALRTAVSADPEGLAGSGARFVILPLDFLYYNRLERALAKDRPLPGPTRRRHASRLKARQIAAALRRAWGPPHLVSEGVLVWDLARVERPATARSRAP